MNKKIAFFGLLACWILLTGCWGNSFVEEGDYVSYSYEFSLMNGEVVVTGISGELVKSDSIFLSGNIGDIFTGKMKSLPWYDESLQQNLALEILGDVSENEEIFLPGIGSWRVLSVDDESVLIDFNEPKTYQKLQYQKIIEKIEKK